MNCKELNQQVLNYLTLMFRDFSILLTKRKLPDPYFKFTYAKKKRKEWNHLYKNGKLIVRVQKFVMSEDEMIENMIHLVIHSYHRESGISDMSATANGRYHKKAFRNTALSLGISCGYNSNTGYQLKKISQERKEECMRIVNCYYDDIMKFLDLADELAEMGSVKSTKTNPSYVTYQCPCCHKKVKATDNSVMICGICGVAFERI